MSGSIEPAVAPGGYIDLQVNGFAGVDFNSDALNLDDVRRLCDAIRRDGGRRILATVITAPVATMCRRIAAIAAAIDRCPHVAQTIAGIHVEGPFISDRPGYVGAHPIAATRDADVEIVKGLVDAAAGHLRLLTLAPERDRQNRSIDWLAKHSIRVSAGHTDASLDQLKRAIDAGLTCFTHLGNGCPAQMNRHDNIVQRVLHLSDRLMITLIADGHHIPWFALDNYLRRIDRRRVIIVSDAISAATLGPGRHRLSQQMVHVDDEGAAWSADGQHFAGSATSLGTMRCRLRDRLGIDEATVDRWTVEHPGGLIG